MCGNLKSRVKSLFFSFLSGFFWQTLDIFLGVFESCGLLLYANVFHFVLSDNNREFFGFKQQQKMNYFSIVGKIFKTNNRHDTSLCNQIFEQESETQNCVSKQKKVLKYIQSMHKQLVVRAFSKTIIQQNLQQKIQMLECRYTDCCLCKCYQKDGKLIY